MNQTWRLAVGLTAVAAPVLHSISDVLEIAAGGFTDVQLWLNLVAFVPMPLLLGGIWAVQRPRSGRLGLTGAVLYGVAFAYFLYTTVYSLVRHVPDYAALWAEMGSVYTFFGVLMIVGGLLFAGSALRAGWRPRWAVLLFAVGVVVNLVVGVIAVPDVVQTLGSAVRNLGLVAMGVLIVRDRSGYSATSSS